MGMCEDLVPHCAMTVGACPSVHCNSVKLALVRFHLVDSSVSRTIQRLETRKTARLEPNILPAYLYLSQTILLDATLPATITIRFSCRCRRISEAL